MGRPSLLLLDAADLAHALAQTLRIGVEELLKLRSLLEGDGCLEFVHGRLELWIAHGHARRLPELRQHGLGRAAWREEPCPDVELGFRISELLERRYLGQRGNPLVAPAGERTELAGLDLGEDDGGPRGERVHVAAEQC